MQEKLDKESTEFREEEEPKKRHIEFNNTNNFMTEKYSIIKKVLKLVKVNLLHIEY